MIIAAIVVGGLLIAGAALAVLLVIGAQVASTRIRREDDKAADALRDAEWAHASPREQVRLALLEAERQAGEADV